MKIIKDKSWYEACPPLETREGSMIQIEKKLNYHQRAGGGWRSISFFIALLILVSSCQNQEKEKEITSEKTEKTPDNSEAPSEFKVTKIKDNPTLFENICSVSPMEFTDLYPRIHSISDDAHEKVFILDTLKSLGFEVRETARGDFKYGPRCMIFILHKDSCKIRVDKMYYKTDTVGTFRVTERILVIE